MTKHATAVHGSATASLPPRPLIFCLDGIEGSNHGDWSHGLRVSAISRDATWLTHYDNADGSGLSTIGSPIGGTSLGGLHYQVATSPHVFGNMALYEYAFNASTATISLNGVHEIATPSTWYSGWGTRLVTAGPPKSNKLYLLDSVSANAIYEIDTTGSILRTLPTNTDYGFYSQRSFLSISRDGKKLRYGAKATPDDSFERVYEMAIATGEVTKVSWDVSNVDTQISNNDIDIEYLYDVLELPSGEWVLSGLNGTMAVVNPNTGTLARMLQPPGGRYHGTFNFGWNMICMALDSDGVNLWVGVQTNPAQAPSAILKVNTATGEQLGYLPFDVVWSNDHSYTVGAFIYNLWTGT